ncbi:TPA: hypothetical protein R0C45_002539 [Kluyvera ascorbata F0526]|nr:hypothetical protein [Kluyvera ascorbata F0526]
MKKSAKQFFGAMGSILDLCPAGSYSEYRSSPSDFGSISSDWSNVGDYLSDAVTANEPKKNTTKNSLSRTKEPC